MELYEIDRINFREDYTIVIYGAGKAGRIIHEYLRLLNVKNIIVMCDKNSEKHNKESIPAILSVYEASKCHNPIFLVGFMNNNEEKIKSAETSLKELNVSKDKIFFVDMNCDFGINVYIDYMREEIMNTPMLKSEVIEKVKNIVFLSYGFNEEIEKKVNGGPLGAICMQKKYLGSHWGKVLLQYPYYNLTERINYICDRFPWITNTILDTKDMVLKGVGKGCIYIVNDIFSAYGVYLAGGKYSLIYHGQGDVVNEITHRGEFITNSIKKMIYEIERIALENAHFVLFPSNGAERHFRDSFEGNIEYNGTDSLYNAIYDFATVETVDEVQRDDTCITFLSVGQMTELKGMDRIPDFICQYAKYTGKKVRWVAVGDGICREEIQRHMGDIVNENDNIQFVLLNKKISHGQIYYLNQISDVYIMLHRVSIFDFSTLEAMYSSRPIILSNIPGNDEYNIENNIMLFDENTCWKDVCAYIENKESNGLLNKEIYTRFFSEESFKKRYHSFIKSFVKKVEKT